MSLRPSEIGAAAAQPDPLFLGRLDEESLRRELEECGVLGALAKRGYEGVRIHTRIEGGEHRILVQPRRGVTSLIDLRLAEVSSVVEESLMRRCGLEVLSLLSVRWLSLQDPRRAFTAQRPRLPGQRYAGLGLSRRLYARALAWAQAWGKDGVANVPEYFHNARFYSGLFRFLSPVRQGRFEALARDLASLHVASSSFAVLEGRIREEPGGVVVRWEPGEMVAPITAGLRDYLDSAEYRAAVDAARESVRFRTP